MAMLDLSVYKQKTFDVILVDGKEVSLPTPTQRLILKLVEAEEFINKASGKKGNNTNSTLLLKRVNALVVDILNTNTQGYTFDLEYVEKEFNLDLIMILLDNYMKFIQDINSDPN